MISVTTTTATGETIVFKVEGQQARSMSPDSRYDSIARGVADQYHCGLGDPELWIAHRLAKLFAGTLTGSHPPFPEGPVSELEKQDFAYDFGKHETAAIEKAGNGVMIAYMLPADLAAVLAVPGGEKSTELHVTIAYLGKAEQFSEDQQVALKRRVAAVASRYAPLQGDLGGLGLFPASESSDNRQVAVRLVDVPYLESLRETLLGELKEAGFPVMRNHGYTPHVTLQYAEKINLEDYESLPELITIDALTLAISGERFTYPMNGSGVFKSVGPTSSSVHVDRPMGSWDEEFGGRRKKKPKRKKGERGMAKADVTLQGTITKLDTKRQLVFGWASVAEVAGKALTDTQGDVLSQDEMEKMAYNYVQDARTMGVMHKEVGLGRLVESMVFTQEKQKALGVDLGKSGWWVGFRVTDPEVWKRVEKGELKAFSIHGKGTRTKIEE